MRIVFMGTPEFAVASLDSLVKNNFEVVGVITSPDKPAGRGQQLSQSAVKKYAAEHQLNILQPSNLKDETFLKELKELKADLQIVVAFRMLPEAVWNMPPLGTYNLHASLLPRYRGAAPINWAIINGDSETGVTTFKLKHEIDTGNVLFNEKVPVGETMDAGMLHDVLMEKGAGLIVRTVREIERRSAMREPLSFLPQNDQLVTHAPKIFRETCRIDWNKPGLEIYNLIRGLSPYPAAFTEIHAEGQPTLSLKLFVAIYEPAEHRHTNGSLLTDGKTFIKAACQGGYILFSELQLQGKRRMTAAEFLRGFKLPEGAKCG